jgi:hypothetical protein
MLFKGAYSNKVDIWAMGCILYQLYTGSKAFITDMAVFDYSHSNAPFPIHGDESFNHPEIEGTVKHLLQIDPHVRPTANELVGMFSRYAKTSRKQSLLNTDAPVIPLSDLEMEPIDWDNKLSWTDPSSDSITPIFQKHGEKKPTDWMVLEAFVNKPNTRLALLCSDVLNETYAVRLYTVSGVVLWEKEDVMPDNPQKIVHPAFNDDGLYLGVYINQRIEVLNAREGTTVISIVLEKIKPVALAVGGRHGTNVAVTSHKETQESGQHIEFTKVRLNPGQAIKYVDVVYMNNKTNFLTYMCGGRRLIVLGEESDKELHKNSFIAWFFDANSRKLLNSYHILPQWNFPEVKLYFLKPIRELCVAFHCTQGSEKFFTVREAEGRNVGECWTPRCLMTSASGCMVFLLSDYNIHVWGKRICKIGSIEDEDLPAFYQAKGIAISENQVTLVLDNEQFIYFRKS